MLKEAASFVLASFRPSTYPICVGVGFGRLADLGAGEAVALLGCALDQAVCLVEIVARPVAVGGVVLEAFEVADFVVFVFLLVVAHGLGVVGVSGKSCEGVVPVVLAQ